MALSMLACITIKPARLAANALLITSAMKAAAALHVTRTAVRQRVVAEAGESGRQKKRVQESVVEAVRRTHALHDADLKGCL